MQLKHVESEPRLGELVYSAPENWKISCLWEAHGNWMAGIYANDNPRNRSKILWNGEEVYSDNSETIGQPLKVGAYIGSVGERNGVIVAFNGVIQKRFDVKWASWIGLWRNLPVTIDWNGKRNNIRECVNGSIIGTIPSTGIALSAVENHGLLFAATADSDDHKHGIACSDGTLVKVDACQCIVLFCGKMFYSSHNRVYQYGGGSLGELACEKIMDMRVVYKSPSNPHGVLRISGSNPDSVWDVDNMGHVRTVGVITTDNEHIGGSCFRVRASENYFARCKHGTQGEVYRIK